MAPQPATPPAPSTEVSALQARVAALEAALEAQTRRADELARAAAEAIAARDDTQTLVDTLLATIPSGVAIFDADLRFVHVNLVLAGVDGQAADQYPGVEPADLQPQLARLLEPYLRQAVETGVPTLNLPIHGFIPSAPTATRNWVASFYPLDGADGRRRGVVVVVREETERLRAEQAIRERDAQLLLALEAADLGTLRYDPGSTTIALDGRARAHFGLAEPTVTHGELWAALHPEDAPRLMQAMRAVAEPGAEGPFVQEVRVALAGGAERWLALQARRFIMADGPAGTLVQIVGTSQDITTRKTAEAALRSAYARAEASARAAAEHAASLDSLLAHAPIGISLLDTELRFRHVNTHLAALNGLSPESHLGRMIGEVLPALASELEAVYGHVLAAGEPLRDLEITGEAPAVPGLRRIWRASYFPVRTADGALLGAGVVISDITAQREAEQALKVKHQQIETILQTMDEGVLAFRPDGSIIALNAVARQLVGLDPRAEPASLAEAIAAAQALAPDGESAPIPRVLRGERFSNLELRVNAPGEAGDRWLAVSGTPAHDADGALTLAVLTVRDITQRKRIGAMLQAHAEILSRTNAELTRALRLKDEFLAMMSHELRTPLNAVLGFTESMEEGLYGPVTERQQHALAQVAQSGRHLLGILSDILDLTRLEAGAVQLDHELVDVERLCRASLHQVAERAQTRGVSLLCSLAPARCELRADEGRLAQILVNLLDNAVKFTPAGGTVGLEVVADAAREQTTLSVWDTGIGIDPIDMERLFQPFTQVDGRLARKHEGIGLGLTLVRRLVELHGGSVRLESAPGRGSRFTVRLPWSLDYHAGVAPPTIEGAPWPGVRAPRVLLADDHERTLAAYTTLLGRAGCEVATARSGVEAVARAQATRPDLALVALQLREPDGLATIRQLRHAVLGDPIPIIALSTVELPGDPERILAAGAARFLARPVSGPLLLETLRSLLAAACAHQPGTVALPEGSRPPA